MWDLNCLSGRQVRPQFGPLKVAILDDGGPAAVGRSGQVQVEEDGVGEGEGQVAGLLATTVSGGIAGVAHKGPHTPLGPPVGLSRAKASKLLLLLSYEMKIHFHTLPKQSYPWLSMNYG